MQNVSTNERDEREITVVKEYVTWDDIETFIQILAEKTNNFAKYNGVYGPARGGVVFATIISNRYGIPYLGAPQKGCILVDDICDSGNTALAWKDKGYTIATMYFKNTSLVEPNFWWKEKGDKWIVFPIEEDTRNKKNEVDINE